MILLQIRSGIYPGTYMQEFFPQNQLLQQNLLQPACQNQVLHPSSCFPWQRSKSLLHNNSINFSYCAKPQSLTALKQAPPGPVFIFCYHRRYLCRYIQVIIIFEFLPGILCVNPRCLHAGMAHQITQASQRHTFIQRMCGKSVTKQMRKYPFLYSRSYRFLFHSTPSHLLPSIVSEDSLLNRSCG